MFNNKEQEKTFRGDLQSIIGGLEAKRKFAFSKYADGEFHILANAPINNGEFWFSPEEDQEYRKQLIDSFQNVEDGYYVGIACPCCIGGERIHNWMKINSKQPTEKLTWANIFVNGNFDYYLEHMVPLYKEYNVYLVSNDASNLDQLPFEVKKHFKIGKNAWNADNSLKDEIVNFIKTENITDSLFLFCAGPFGNILTSHCWKNDKNNTYIDIGSTLNIHLLGNKGANRGYLRGESSRNKICTWG